MRAFFCEKYKKISIHLLYLVLYKSILYLKVFYLTAQLKINSSHLNTVSYYP